MVTQAPARRSLRRWKLTALDRKLVRDLRGSRGQALAIALVIGAGISVFLSMFSTFDSLDLTVQTYYERARFGDVFVSLKRAPLSRASDLAAIPGVARVEARVVVDVTLDVRGLSEPAIGRLISIPSVRRPILCDLVLRKGRYIEPGRPDEVVASESFAVAHGLEPGNTIGAIINGRRRELQITGLALSPEYVYPVRPGELLPDEKHFGIFWMEGRALAAAFDMEGAFNNAVLTLTRGASEPAVIAQVDRLLEPDYGGLGAIPRSLQPSHWYLNNELAELRTSGAIVPAIFLAVAAFLLNVVLSRFVLVQRAQIAALKALGYGNTAVAWHYVKWSIVVASVGAVMGVLSGAYFGWAMTRLYTLFFHFPLLLYRLELPVVIESAAIALAAAVLGAAGAVRRAVSLPPAEAMRPEAPARFSETWVERAGLKRLLTQPARIIFRTLQRHPGRALLSIVGIALAASLLVVGNVTADALDVMMTLQFDVAARYDVMVSTVAPASSSALDEFRRLPGVMDVEPFRAVPARLRIGHRSRHTGILGVPGGARLNRVVGASMRAVDLPQQGLVLSAKLAELLGAGRDDLVTIEVLEGCRPVNEVPIAALVDDYMGTNAYMDLDALHRLMGEGTTLSGAYLQVDRSQADTLYRQLKATPRVGGVLLKRAAIETFQSTFKEMLTVMQAIFVGFAVIIAFGVVYNTARISLSERSRELATLRVIGFTRAEISYILLGELVLVTLVAIPFGLIAGYAFAALVVTAFESEMFRIPLVIAPRTYAYAAVVIIVATAISAMVVRHRLDHLDLVEVLKTRE